jgi:hypothetical protein
MLQMRLPRGHTNFMMLTRTEDSFPVLTHHRAADHGHCSAYLADFAVDPYFRSFNRESGFGGMRKGEV